MSTLVKNKVRIQRVTSKGQITLPVSWRNHFNTENVAVRANGHIIEISPVHFEEQEMGWDVIFNSERDNAGKGIPISEFRAELKKINHTPLKVKRNSKN